MPVSPRKARVACCVSLVLLLANCGDNPAGLADKPGIRAVAGAGISDTVDAAPLQALVVEVSIKRMKTRWGSCNDVARRIWLNLELAKKPASCLEYIFVHEMVHMVERHHNERFMTLMDELMPTWRLRRDELNRTPLAHEEWRY